MAPNRIAVYLTSTAALLGGLAPIVADLDTTSTAGVLVGVGAIVAVVNKWLEGWQKHEARTIPVKAVSSTVTCFKCVRSKPDGAA